MSGTASDRSDFNIAAHGLRGVASAAVLLAHLAGGAAEHIYADRREFVEAIDPWWNFGTFFVFMFFTISGFVILPSAMRYSAREFAARRLMRIYPLFLFFSLLFIALNFATNRQPELNDPVAIVSALLFLNLFTGTEQLTPNAWSLTYEVMFYAMTCAFVVAAFRLRRPGLVDALIALSVILVILFPKALFFLGGVVIRLLHDRGVRPAPELQRRLEIASFLIFVAFASSGKRDFHPDEFSDLIVYGTMASCCLYFYFATAPTSYTARLLDNRIASYLGVVSYSLYLLHPYVYLPARLAFERFGLFTDDIVASMILFYLVVVPATLAATHVVHVALERWPYRLCFRKDVYAPRAGAERAGAAAAGNSVPASSARI